MYHNHNNEVLSNILWEYEGQTQIPLKSKAVVESPFQALYGIIALSHHAWAHNLCKSSQGLTISTVSIVWIVFINTHNVVDEMDRFLFSFCYLM